MIVVADTSPISYLILIDQADVLSQLYGRILIPPAVFRELTASGAPEKVRTWFADRPEWIDIRELANPLNANLTDVLDLVKVRLSSSPRK